MCVRAIDFASFYDLSIGFWYCSDNVIFYLFLIFITMVAITDNIAKTLMSRILVDSGTDNDT